MMLPTAGRVRCAPAPALLPPRPAAVAAPAGPGAGRAQRRPLAPAAATAPAGQGAGRTQRHLLARYPLRRAGPPRAASAGGEPPLPEQPLAADNPILEVERQEERALAYTGITAMLGTAGLALAVAPARAVEFVWAACPSLIVQGLARTFGSFLLLAAVCSYCLKEAAEHDRLKSETYQRLNLALFWWGLGTIVALWWAPQQPMRLALGVCTALLGAASAHAALTYQETSDQGLNPLYLLKQFLKSLGNLSSYANDANTSIYALYAYGLSAKATVAASAAILAHGKLRVMQDGLLQAPLGTLGVSLLPCNGMGYALAAVVLYTLKDAASRGRLGASTFKALNIGISVVALTNALGLASWMQAGLLAKTRLAAFKIAAHVFLAAVALYNYAFAKK